tara:strand:- start:212 stop:1012 length:801 start_codon:yes stop_codon:yes gene_type:complete
MKNAIATLHSPWNYQELADLTNPNKERYCAKHGYDFHPRFSNLDYAKYRADPNRPMGINNWHSGFQKIGHVLDLLKCGEYEWVFWLGCDTLITNFDIKIEDVADNDYHFIVANDCNEWNSDSFMVRSSEEGIAWMERLDDSVDKYASHVWGEQQAMIDLRDPFYTRQFELAKAALEEGAWVPAAPVVGVAGTQSDEKIIKVVPQEDINSYEYGIYGTPQHQAGRDILGNNGRWTKGHYIVHWPGATLGHRIVLAQKYLKEYVIGDD